MKNAPTRTETEAKPRLGRADWLRAALNCLIEDGIEAVQITRLATAIGTSRGSFYWHFKSRQELLDGLMDEWFALNSEPINRLLASTPSLDRGVLSFFAIWADPEAFSPKLEQAVRDWARLDDRILAIVRAEDSKRVAAIAAFFQRFYYHEEDATVRARVLYYAQVGYFAMNIEEAIEERLSMLKPYYFAFTGRELDEKTAQDFMESRSSFT